MLTENEYLKSTQQRYGTTQPEFARNVFLDMFIQDIEPESQ